VVLDHDWSFDRRELDRSVAGSARRMVLLLPSQERVTPRQIVWGLVVIVIVVFASVTTLLALHIDVTPLLGLLNLLVLPIVGYFIYNKVADVKTDQKQVISQTNGVYASQSALMRDMWEHFKTTQQALQASVISAPSPTAVNGSLSNGH
jgi:hypothetical protein